MNYLKPPYSKAHIIVLGSLAFFLGIGLLLAFNNDLPRLSFVNEKPDISGEDVKEKYQEQLHEVQEGDHITAMLRDNFIILDVRPYEEYLERHIKGSMPAPAEFIHNNMYQADTTVVLYSQNSEDLSKARAALQDMGLTDIETLSDSLDSLENQGYQLESGESSENEGNGDNGNNGENGDNDENN